MPAIPLVAAIDAGSERTRCAVGALEHGALRFAGFGEAPSSGWSRGRIADPQALSQSILHAARSAAQDAASEIDSVIVGVGGPDVRSCSAGTLLEPGHRFSISREDVAAAFEEAARAEVPDGHAILHVLPEAFALDGRRCSASPLGREVSSFGAQFRIVTVSDVEHRNLLGCVNAAHLIVEETVFEPIAAWYATGRSGDAAIVDIGAHSTGIAVFRRGALHFAASLPIGGGHFTRDLAACLKLPVTDAETLKLGHRGLSTISDPGGIIGSILECRAEELCLSVRRAIGDSLPDELILTGGGSLLYGLADVAERIVERPVRLGGIGLPGWPEHLAGPRFCTAAGLLQYAARLRLAAVRR